MPSAALGRAHLSLALLVVSAGGCQSKAGAQGNHLTISDLLEIKHTDLRYTLMKYNGFNIQNDSSFLKFFMKCPFLVYKLLTFVIHKKAKCVISFMRQTILSHDLLESFYAHGRRNESFSLNVNFMIPQISHFSEVSVFR